MREPFAGQQRIVVPLAGPPPRAGASRDLCHLLDWMWVAQPPPDRPFAITDVLALIARDPESLGRAATYSVILLLSAPHLRANQRLDVPRMEHDLRSALNAVYAIAE